MPMGKEVGGYRGHLRPAWASWQLEALITVGAGPPAHLEEELWTARPGPFVGYRHKRRLLSPLTLVTETRGACGRGALCSEEPVARGWLRPCDTASPPPARPQTVGYPGCREPSPSAPLLPARASRFPSQGLGAPRRSSGVGSALAPASGVEAK